MSDYHCNTLQSQRDRIIKRLKAGAATTIDLRREEDVLMPAARIFELRNLGYSIDTVFVKQQSDCGQMHSSIAKYLLVAEPLVLFA